MTISQVIRSKSAVAVRHVVVPVDFSALSWQVAPLAQHIATRLGADVQTVHIDTASPWRDSSDAAMLRLRTTPYGRHEDILVAPAAHAADGILDVAGYGPDSLIAMSTHGHSGVGEIALGSVCEEVLRRHDEPILLTGPRFDIARYGFVRRIVACVDLTSGGDAVVPDALAWARALDVPLQVVTVLPRRSNPDTALGAEALQFSRLIDAIEDSEGRVSGLLLEGARPAREIVEHARGQRGTLLAMTTHARPAVVRAVAGSTVMSTLRHTPSGVLVRRRP
jgi:nucleotide-binding universal stress UspA family protein